MTDATQIPSKLMQTYIAGRRHSLADAILTAFADEREKHLAGLGRGATSVYGSPPQLAVHLQQERQKCHKTWSTTAYHST